MNTEAKVGAFVLVCAAIFLGTIYRLGNIQLRGERVPYRTYLRYAGGLEPGADVLFGGIKVGSVTTVRPDPQDPTRIEILMDVKKGTPVNAKSVAKLGSVTVITNPVISISMGSNDAARLPPNGEIASLESVSLDDTQRKIVGLADSAKTMIDAVNKDINDITGDARDLIGNLKELTGKPNQERVAGILKNSEAMIASLSPKIDRMSDQVLKLTSDADAVIVKVGPAVDNVDRTVSNANDTITAVREPLQADLIEIRKTLEQARGLIGEVQGSLRAKDQGVTETLENLRVVTANLSELTESVKARPWSLVRIKQPKDRKVPE